MSVYEDWSLAVNIIAFGALAWQLVLLRQSTKLDHARRRKQATMDYLTATMDRRVAYRAQGIPEERDTTAIARLIGSAVAGDPDADELIRGYLTLYNFLGVAGRTDAFDLEVIDFAWGGRIISAKENYTPWIVEQRNRYHEPRLYEELDWLAARMTVRRVPARLDPRPTAVESP